ncbi:MAG: hypothetical protein M3176_18680, partial [Chloroflexota bacterium]|nr:hypothetical protein [Chloroflexota bacterium]
GLSRREMIKGTLKAGVYAAPVILSSGRVAAQSLPSGTPFPATITFGQDALLTNTGANASFAVYSTLSTQPVGTLTLLGTITTDGFGFGGGVFPLTLDTRAVTSVKLTYILSGNPPTSPPAATFTSTLVAALRPVNGARGPVTFVGLVVQEPTAAACQVGPLNQFTEYVDVAILNAPPGIMYTIFVQPNTLGAPVVVTTATTNGQGNVTVFAPTPAAVTSASVPTAVVVTAAPPAGSGLPTLTLTASATNGNLTTIGCTTLTSMARTSAPRAIGITQP